LDFSIDDQENLNTYSFNLAEYDPDTSTLNIYCTPGLKLRMEVSALKIQSEDLEVRGKARISYLFGLIESDRAS